MSELKTVNVEEETWKALSRLKIDLGLDSLDAVIVRLLKAKEVAARA